jgi:DNA-binding CsgD family transcriptional regulator
LGGVAGATHPADRAALAAAVAAGAGPAKAAPAQMICRLSRRSRRLPLVARTVPLSRAEAGAGGRGASGAAEALALLLVVDPEEAGRIDAEGIAALGRLSPAELEVCEMIVAGHASAVIASARGTSVATTADQVKSALGKLACATRLDILRLAMATRPPGRSRGHPPDGG